MLLNRAILLTFTIVPLVSGWGGLFSRFNPSLFAQFGFGEDGVPDTVLDDSAVVSYLESFHLDTINEL
jgi:hypothetical protein